MCVTINERQITELTCPLLVDRLFLEEVHKFLLYWATNELARKKFFNETFTFRNRFRCLELGGAPSDPSTQSSRTAGAKSCLPKVQRIYWRFIVSEGWGFIDGILFRPTKGSNVIRNLHSFANYSKINLMTVMIITNS